MTRGTGHKHTQEEQETYRRNRKHTNVTGNIQEEQKTHERSRTNKIVEDTHRRSMKHT